MIQDISMTASAEASGRASARRNSKSTTTGKIRLLDGAVKIDGKLHSLNPGVQIWKRRGVDKLIVRVFLANGSTQTKSYPITPDGVKQANEQAKLNSKEIASYGADFGALSVMERQAIEFYRQYEKECIGMGIQPYGVLNVLWKSIEWAKAATCGAPLFPEDEAATNAAAAAYTSAQKEAVAKYNLWGLYDAAAKAEGADKDAAQKAYNESQEKAQAEYDAQ